MLAVFLTMLGVARGIHARSPWAGRKFLLPFFLGMLFAGLGLVHGYKISWLLYLLLPLETALWLFALYHLAKIPSGYWKERKKGIKGLFQWHVLLSLFLFLSLLEIAINAAGYTPGKVFPPRYFHQVDQLVLREDYFADEAGITKITPEGRELAAHGTWKGRSIEAYQDTFSFSPSTYSIFVDNAALLAGKVDNSFSRFLDSIQGIPDSLLDAAGRLYLDYRLHPINEDGFRSIPFTRLDNCNRKKVLLVGDSFTFGWSARPWTDAFADCLSARGYLVYNAGITATNPAQYAAVARKYVPLLKPDVVIANVFLGNDVVHYPQATLPGEMAYYPTNAGVMMAQPGCDRLPNADSAYRFYSNEYFLDREGGFLERLLARSSIGTLVWRVGARLGRIPGKNWSYWKASEECRSEVPISESYLLEIKALSEAHGAAFICGLIPDMEHLAVDLAADYPGLFSKLQPRIPSLEEADFNAREAHFNARGHERYARFLDSLVQVEMQKGTPQ